MAVIKFTNSKSSIKKILDYITQPSKTEECLISGKDCMPESALSEMELVKSMYGKSSGRQYIHIVQSFDTKDELTHEKANAVGVQLAERFTGFQAVIATHKDRNHIHNHILLNSVNFETGLKFQQSKKDMQEVKDFSDTLCLENGLSVIGKPNKDSDIQRNEYQAAVKGISWKIALMLTIDDAMQESENRDEFISNMNRLGYKVNWTDTRKNITYTTPDGKKCRDNKLHDPKYLKEAMENEFNRIKEQSAVNSKPAAEYERTDDAANHNEGHRTTAQLHERQSVSNGKDEQKPDNRQQRNRQTDNKPFSKGKTASQSAGNAEKTTVYSANNAVDNRRRNNKRNSILADIDHNKELVKAQPIKEGTISKGRVINERQ